MRHGVIVAALPSELRPLVRGWTHTTRGGAQIWQRPKSREEDWTWTAACAGIGRTPALRALAAAEAAVGAAGQMISVGFAGALTESFLPGRVYSVSETLDVSTGQAFSSDNGSPAFARAAAGAVQVSAEPVVLLTLDRVADAGAKRRLASEYSAHLVDMEAAALAQVARGRDLPFYCLKGVSDGPNDALPANPALVAPNGRLRYGRLIGYAALRPWLWPHFLRLGQNSATAARGLKTALLAVMDDAS